jgi:hypothetical protein
VRLGVLDPMVVERWEPPRLCHVRHTGRVVRGTGTFEVVDRGEGRSRFLWRRTWTCRSASSAASGGCSSAAVRSRGAASLRRFARWTEAGRAADAAAA